MSRPTCVHKYQSRLQFLLRLSLPSLFKLTSPPSMPRMLLNSEDYHGLAVETTFSHHPQSELTFSGSAGSKERGYMALTQNNDLQIQSRLDGSTGATTSGRPLAMVAPPFSGDISSSRYSQSVEIDALVKFQTEQLQSGIELLRRKHSRELLSMVEEQAAKRLRVKEMGLEYVCKRNMELEEKVRQLAAETQIWFNYAKTSEAEVSSLRAKLEQALTNQISCPVVDAEEGYGDSGGHPFPSTDNPEEESATENQIQRACRVCREREVCVLLLPCRHLCVCKGCESRIETCPVCNSIRNASIQVVLPSC